MKSSVSINKSKGVSGAGLIDRLLAERHSLQQTERIAREIGESSLLFGSLMRRYLGEDPVLAQRAAWVMSKVACRHPGLMRPWWKKALQRSRRPCHDAIRRNLLKVLECSGVPEAHESEVLEACLGWLADRSQPIAVHAYALTIVHAMVQRYPELEGEFKAVAGLLREKASPGLRSRLRKLGL